MWKRAKVLTVLQRGLDLNSVLKKSVSLFSGREGAQQDTKNITNGRGDDSGGGGGGGDGRERNGGGDGGGRDGNDEDDGDFKGGHEGCVVAALAGGVPEEQHVKQHNHRLQYGGSSLAAFIKRRRKEKRLLARFLKVEDLVQQQDPRLAEDLSQLREEHQAYEVTWCRLRYHPRLLKTKEEEEKEEDVKEEVIMEEVEEEKEEEVEEEENQEDIDRLLDPNSDLTLGMLVRPPKIQPRVNTLWRVRLSAAEREKQERRRRLHEAREALKKKLSVASMNGGVNTGNFGSSRAGSYVSLATRQYRQRHLRLSSLTPLDVPMQEGGKDLPVSRSFLPLRRNSTSSAFLPPPPYSALERSGKIKVKEYKQSIAPNHLRQKAVTKVKPFKFHETGSKKKHWCVMYHY